MEKFSLVRTTAGDCYRIANRKTGGECEREKSNEKICQDLEIKVLNEKKNNRKK